MHRSIGLATVSTWSLVRNMLAGKRTLKVPSRPAAPATLKVWSRVGVGPGVAPPVAGPAPTPVVGARRRVRRARRRPAARACARRRRSRRRGAGRRARASRAAHFAAQALGAAEVERGTVLQAHREAASVRKTRWRRAQERRGRGGQQRDGLHRRAGRSGAAARERLSARAGRPAPEEPRSSVPSAATGTRSASAVDRRRRARTRRPRCAGGAGRSRSASRPRTTGNGSTAVRSSSVADVQRRHVARGGGQRRADRGGVRAASRR